MWGFRMCNCNEEINKKCPNRVCAYCDWHLELQAKEQECEELKQRINTRCFDTKNNNNRCISYNRIAQDYEIDLKRLNKYKRVLEEIEEFCTVYSDNHDAYETVYKFILSIINKSKEK